MEFKLIAMSERNKIVYLELEAKPVIEEMSIKDKMIQNILKNFPEGSDEGKMMSKIIPSLVASLPDSLESGMMMSGDGSMMPVSMKPKMTVLIDEQQLLDLQLKLGDVVRMTLENLRLEKSKTSEKSSNLISKHASSST